MTQPTGSSGHLTTDVATMEVVAGQLQESRAELDAILGRLTGVVQSAPSVWRSRSAEQFAGIMERWNVNHTKLSTALDELAEAVRTSGRSYAAAEEHHARSLSSIDPDSGSVLNGSFT
ncbi:WXG100 family type VII secretion target [Rhodococcus sp. NPDC047139]|uniref:WXG100 family type VII secretion target n=1 Tax=Rhodococcus sp. NPDC047139 TaxID=3155141 RepID=UPI0033C1DB56